MASYTPPELRRLWSQGKLTTEQATGHLIQNLELYFERQAALE